MFEYGMRVNGGSPQAVIGLTGFRESLWICN